MIYWRKVAQLTNATIEQDDRRDVMILMRGFSGDVPMCASPQEAAADPAAGLVHGFPATPATWVPRPRASAPQYMSSHPVLLLHLIMTDVHLSWTMTQPPLKLNPASAYGHHGHFPMGKTKVQHCTPTEYEGATMVAKALIHTAMGQNF